VTEPWETLWDNAMKALDSLEPAFPRKIDWSFGGGTAMRLFYDHRESKDVDIFVTDPYVISGLSPRLNNATQELTDDYNEQSNLLKLRFPEGEVDFIVGGRLIEAVSLAEKHIRGRDVRVEQPIEIVAKKCFYRAADFTARDIFDLAVLLDEEPDTVRQYENVLLAKRDVLRQRLGAMSPPMRGQIEDALNSLAVTPAYEHIRTRAIDMVLDFITRGR
jgi:predicted nucleotidyltransferase component of viral defense system